jgi:hypothetical protein
VGLRGLLWGELQLQGSTNVPKFGIHIQILGARMVIRSKFHTEDPQFRSDPRPAVTWRFLLCAFELMHIFVGVDAAAVLTLKVLAATVQSSHGQDWAHQPVRWFEHFAEDPASRVRIQKWE